MKSARRRIVLTVVPGEPDPEWERGWWRFLGGDWGRDPLAQALSDVKKEEPSGKAGLRKDGDDGASPHK